MVALGVMVLSLGTVCGGGLESFLAVLNVVVNIVTIMVLMSVARGTADNVASDVSDVNSSRVATSVASSSISVATSDLRALRGGQVVDNMTPVVSAGRAMGRGSRGNSCSVINIARGCFSIRGIGVRDKHLVTPSSVR